MSKLKLRPLKRSDLCRFAWLNAVFPKDTFSEELLFEKTFGDPRFDPAYSRVLGNCLGLIIAVPTSDSCGTIKLLAIHPKHQGDGHGERLLNTIHKVFRRQKRNRVMVGGGAPNYLWSGVETDSQAFWEDHGYEVLDKSVDMTVPLKKLDFDVADAIDCFDEMGVRVRRALPSDRDALRYLLINHWSTWIPEVALAMERDPISVFVAEMKGRIVAFAVHSANNFSWGSFGPTGTTRSMRGYGLGQLLLKACLQDLRDQDFESCRIQWVGPVGFYEKSIGAKVSHRFARMQRSLA